MFKLLAIIFLWIGSLFSIFMTLLDYQSRNNPIPECVKDVYDEQTYSQWQQYNGEKNINSIIFSIINLLVYTIILISNILPIISNSISDSVVIQVGAIIGFVTIIDTIISTIDSYIINFKIEEKYGFNKMSKKTFIIDTIKGLIISLIISIGLISLFGLLYNAFEDNVIYIFTLIAICLVLIVTALYPKLAKIYNKFTPLQEGSLKEKLIDLLERHNYKVEAINVMDASKRTSKSNAYFSGLGKSKTIVLYDTLIDNMTEEEILAVFAHELGHGLHKDTLKNSLLSFFNVALIVIIAWCLVKNIGLYQEFGFEKVNYGFAFIILSSAILPLLSPFIGLVTAFLSRKAEYKADEQAVKEGYGFALISALKKLGRENFTNLSPNKIVVALTYSHPTLAKRIERINALVEMR